MTYDEYVVFDGPEPFGGYPLQESVVSAEQTLFGTSLPNGIYATKNPDGTYAFFNRGAKGEIKPMLSTNQQQIDQKHFIQVPGQPGVYKINQNNNQMLQNGFVTANRSIKNMEEYNKEMKNEKPFGIPIISKEFKPVEWTTDMIRQGQEGRSNATSWMDAGKMTSQ